MLTQYRTFPDNFEGNDFRGKQQTQYKVTVYKSTSVLFRYSALATYSFNAHVYSTCWSRISHLGKIEVNLRDNKLMAVG
jgi:hypothetical protein